MGRSDSPPSVSTRSNSSRADTIVSPWFAPLGRGRPTGGQGVVGSGLPIRNDDGNVGVSQVPWKPWWPSPVLFDPGRIRQAEWTMSELPDTAPACVQDEGSTRLEFSGLNHTTFDLPVYASQDGSPQHHARLASGLLVRLCQAGFVPAGFQRKVSEFESLPPLQSLPDARTSLISTVCEGKEPRGHARKRLMQRLRTGLRKGIFSNVPFFPHPLAERLRGVVPQQGSRRVPGPRGVRERAAGPGVGRCSGRRSTIRNARTVPWGTRHRPNSRPTCERYVPIEEDPPDASSTESTAHMTPIIAGPRNGEQRARPRSATCWRPYCSWTA